MLRALALAALAACASAQCFDQPILLGETITEAVYSIPGSPPYTYQTFVLALESSTSPSNPGPTTVSVVVQGLTPGGNVDVFAAYQTDKIPNAKCPNSTNYNTVWGSSTNAPPLPQVLYVPNNNAGFYYFAVTGFTAGNNLFSITVQDVSPGVYTPLPAGVPAEGMLLPGAPAPVSLYTANFSLTSTSSAMILDFFSYAGIADMYVAVNNPNPPPSAGSAFQLVAGSGANQLVLSGNDPRLTAANCIVNGPVCTVSIALQSATLGAPVYYRLTATPSAQAVNLTDGSPIVRTVAAGAYALFAYTPTAASNVTFSLTVYAGNASVAVSTLGFPIAPAPSTWGIASTLEGGVLTIVTSDPAYNPPASPPYPVFYLVVYAGNATAGAPATTFSIAAQTAAGGQYAAALADGVPQFASAQPHAMAYFLFNYTAAAALGLRGLDVYAAPEGGSAVQVYINPLPFGSLAPSYPTPLCRLTDPVTQLCSVWGAANAMYSSEGGQVPGFVSLVTPPGTLIPSAYLVAVLAVTPDAQSQQGFVPAPPALFTLSASSGAVLQQLQAGALLPGSVRASPKPAGYKYYSFTPSVYLGDSVVSVEVRSGSLEVYAIEYNILRGPAPSAANNASLPGPTNSVWNSSAQAGTGQRSRYLRIPFAQLTPGCQASVRYGLGTCGIAIGVVGNPLLLGSAAYGISASQSNSPSSPLLLNEGTTQYVAIPASQCVFVSGIPSGASQRYGDYVYVANQVGTATMYINFRKQSFWVPGQGLLPDAVFTDQGGFESARVSGSTQTLFITLCAPATGGSEHLITYRNAFDVQPLDDNQRTHGETACFNATASGAGCVPAVYSFSVSDPTASVSFTVQRTLGAVQAYVIQVQPSQPWVLPSPAYSTWSFYPTFFSPTLTIAPTDPLVTCKATADAPCLYYIALYPAENQPAAFDITASADALGITVLYDGQPASGSILDGSSAFYSYRPAAPGVPAPPVTFAWSNLFGAVSLYITNTYAMGVSTASQLPGPAYAGACQWVCTNFTSCAASPGDPCYMPTGPGGGAVVYTVAVVGASDANGTVVNNEYTLTATNAGDPTALALGVPTTDIVLFPFTNTTFVFELDESGGGGGGGGGGLGRDIAYDVLVSASVNHGAVQMLIAPAFGTGFGAPSPPPPACVVPAFGGTRRVCNGAVWQASSGYGDSVVYLSGAYQGGDVCAPVVPPGTIPPTTNASLCAAYFPPASATQGGSLRRGRYYVTLYTQVLSELSLLVQVAGVQAPGDAAPPAIRAVPRTVLADGQPLYLQTGPLTLCPGQARDNATERCPPSPPAPASPTSWTASGSFTVFRIPAGAPMTYLNVIVERLCGGNATGDCGPELYIAVNGCAPNNCTAAQLTPYLSDAYFAYPMREAVAGFQIPFDACYAPGYTPPLPNAAPDCIYAIGVFPRVGHGPSDPTPPGQGAPAQTFRITLSTPTGTQRIPQDCPGSGRLCTLPAQYVAPNQARFYESYASSNAAGTAVALSAQLCYGTSLALYTCVASPTTACSAVSRPSLAGRNYDATAASNALGYAAVPAFTAPSDVYFFAVTGAALPGPPPANAPTYQLSLQHGSGMVLALGGSALSASWDPSATFLTVTWTLPTLTYSGTGVSYPVANLFFILHTFLLGRANAPFQPSTPCGLDYLRDANVSDATAVFLRQADVCSVSGACSYTLTPPSTQYTYQIALSADCSARADPRAPAPGGACMPPGAESQRIAWAVIQDTPNPVPVSGTPSSTATLTATPSPGAPPPPPAAAPAAAPSVAGPVVGSLLALLVAGGLGYAAFHYGLCASGGMSAAYSRLSTMVGGDGARASASSAREALVDHPIFAAGGDKGASAEAEYSQLA